MKDGDNFFKISISLHPNLVLSSESLILSLTYNILFKWFSILT